MNLCKKCNIYVTNCQSVTAASWLFLLTEVYFMFYIFPAQQYNKSIITVAWELLLDKPCLLHAHSSPDWTMWVQI